MDQRRDRRWSRHSIGKPNVERNLRALAGAAEEHEEANRRDEGAARSKVAGLGAHPHEIENTDVREDHEHRDKKSKVAYPVHDERLLARVSVGLIVEPESDEEVRAESDS